MGQISFVRSETRREGRATGWLPGRAPECGDNGLDASGNCGNKGKRADPRKCSEKQTT